MDWLDLLAAQRDSQESSPTPQFKSINSSALSFLYSPTLTSIHGRWKNHSLEQLQRATNSDKFSLHFYSVTQYFLLFLVMVSQILPSFKSRHLISKYMGLSVFDINCSFQSFLLCSYPLSFFSFLTLLRLLMAKSRISLGKCHSHLKIMCVIFKYLLTLIPNIIPQ